MEIFSGSGWLGTIILGGIAGAVGKFIMPGRDPGGAVVTILLGIAGAVLMTALGQITGYYDAGEGAQLVAATLGAVLILWIYRLVQRGRAS
jgi:uncharacterized membrane protein YeaQ/YmgE (transglycosylase-associated protein family)